MDIVTKIVIAIIPFLPFLFSLSPRLSPPRLAPKSYKSEAQYLIHVSFIKHQIRSYTLTIILYTCIRCIEACKRRMMRRARRSSSISTKRPLPQSEVMLLSSSIYFPPLLITRRQYTHARTPMHSYTSHVHTVRIYR